MPVAAVRHPACRRSARRQRGDRPPRAAGCVHRGRVHRADRQCRSHVYAMNGFPLLLEIQHALFRAFRRGVRVRTLFGNLTPRHGDRPFSGPWSAARTMATSLVHSRMDPIVAAGGECYESSCRISLAGTGGGRHPAACPCEDDERRWTDVCRRQRQPGRHRWLLGKRAAPRRGGPVPRRRSKRGLTSCSPRRGGLIRTIPIGSSGPSAAAGCGYWPGVLSA